MKQIALSLREYKVRYLSQKVAVYIETKRAFCILYYEDGVAHEKGCRV